MGFVHSSDTDFLEELSLYILSPHCKIPKNNFYKARETQMEENVYERVVFFSLFFPPPLAAALEYLSKSKPNYIAFKPRPASLCQIVLSTGIPPSMPLLLI